MVYFDFHVLDEPNNGVGVICDAAFRKLYVQPRPWSIKAYRTSPWWSVARMNATGVTKKIVFGNEVIKVWKLMASITRIEGVEFLTCSCTVVAGAWSCWRLYNLKHGDSSAAGQRFFFLVWSPTNVDTRWYKSHSLTHILIHVTSGDLRGRLAFLAKNINKALSSAESELSGAQQASEHVH